MDSSQTWIQPRPDLKHPAERGTIHQAVVVVVVVALSVVRFLVCLFVRPFVRFRAVGEMVARSDRSAFPSAWKKRSNTANARKKR